mmetsp:Transcript_32491/g.44619  ORF Transcript_32491/g.44619 Transcript_32491/m.44619 type:complete len:90 (+) Transcript_32491:284-553(+)
MLYFLFFFSWRSTSPQTQSFSQHSKKKQPRTNEKLRAKRNSTKRKLDLEKWLLPGPSFQWIDLEMKNDYSKKISPWFFTFLKYILKLEQ